MKWWTHLWLNEGFATFIEYLCVDYCLGPEYDIWTQFNSQTYSPALKGDALANSHPIEVCVCVCTCACACVHACVRACPSTVIADESWLLVDDSIDVGLHWLCCLV